MSKITSSPEATVSTVAGPEMMVPIQLTGWGDSAHITAAGIGKNEQWLIQIGFIHRPSKGTRRVWVPNHNGPDGEWVEKPNPPVNKPRVLRNARGEAIVFKSQDEAWAAIRDGRVLKFWQDAQAKSVLIEKQNRETAQRRQFNAQGLRASDLVQAIKEMAK